MREEGVRTIRPRRDPGRSDVERRLERLAREQIGVFAVREALRAAPLLATAAPGDVARLSALSFRAILTACVATFVSQAKPSARSAAAAAFSAATTANAAHSAIYAAARAGTAAVAPDAASAAYAGYAAAYSAARAAAAHTTILAESSHDLERLETALSAEELRAAPLWPFGAPPEFQFALDRLADTMLQRGPQCSVWVDWYATKIAGWPTLLPFEREWSAV